MNSTITGLSVTNNTTMERFQHYGKLEKITEGSGKLHLEDGKKHDVSFEIAKRGEEKLLFNLISEGAGTLDTFALVKSEGLERIEGFDENGRKIIVTGLLAKDSTVGSETDSKVVLNGYAGQCEIGKKNIKAGCTIHFDLMNFLFLGNETKVEESEKGKKYSRSILQLKFSDFRCRIEHVDEYSIIKQLLKRQGGVLTTSTLITEIEDENDYEDALENVRKLCQLLSVARSTFINWGSCRIKNAEGDVIYELHGNALTRPFHGSNLITDLSEDTVEFLRSSWKAYDKYEKIFDMKRFLYGYADTYMNSFIETRSLNIAVLTDNICSKWAAKEKREYFFDQDKFSKLLPKLKKGVHVLLEIVFDKIKKPHTNAMLSKIPGFNRRPLDWKLKRFRKAFNCPISDDEIQHFVYIRDSLAHTSQFPDDVKSKEAFFFMRHFLDRIVLRVLGYSGDYFDMENLIEKPLISN